MVPKLALLQGWLETDDRFIKTGSDGGGTSLEGKKMMSCASPKISFKISIQRCQRISQISLKESERQPGYSGNFWSDLYTCLLLCQPPVIHTRLGG